MLRFCALASGSSGNALAVSDGKTRLLIDAGLTGKKIEEGLKTLHLSGEDLAGILVTHEHRDHIQSVGVLSRRFKIPVYMSEGTCREAMEQGLLGKISPENCKTFRAGSALEIGTMKIDSFPTPHDACEPVGYTITADDVTITIATDLGCVTSQVERKAREADLLLLETNHDVTMLKNGSYPYTLKQRILSDTGHLSNDAAKELAVHACRAKTKTVLLGHLSKENNRPELAHKTVKQALLENDILPGRDVSLHLTYRDRPTGVFKVEKE